MRKTLSTLALLGLFILISPPLHAQQRNCSTMEVLDRLIRENPQLEFQIRQIEEFTQRNLESGVDLRVDEPIKIPVVVHILYENSAENVSDAQVQSQIDVLNEDFRRANLDADESWPQAADTKIEFCLATVAPDGSPTTGINRRMTTVSSFGTNDRVKFQDQGGYNAWPAGEYLNFWVCDIGGGILGYAQFPGGDPLTDGVVVDYRYFGRGGSARAPFDLGRTATHEVGHWLNLRHIWGDGPCRFDDFVEDTPESSGANYGCDIGSRSCRSIDMVQNYMDYSDDGCMNLFTAGQGARMNTLFAPGGARESLLSSPAICGGSPPPPPPPAQEICDNGIDDDGDGFTDCDDDDCVDASVCAPTGDCEAPTGLTTQTRKGGREAVFSWNPVPGATSYDITLLNASGQVLAGTTIENTSAVASNLSKGAEYQWCVSANCGTATSSESCQSFTAARSSREAEWADNSLKIYPNPARDLVTVEFNELTTTGVVLNAGTTPVTDQTYFVYLLDVTGRVIDQYQTTGSETRIEIPVSDLSPGLYLIKITDEEGNVENAGKVLINR